MNFEVLERGKVSEPNRFFSSNSLFPFLYALPVLPILQQYSWRLWWTLTFPVTVLTAAEHNLVKSKADLERLRVERRGGHWLRRLLGFYCRSLVRTILLWSPSEEAAARDCYCLTLWLRIWRLVSPCWLEVQICKKGVCGDVRSLSRHVRCSMSPPVQGNSGVPLWRHTKARAEDRSSPYFLLWCVYRNFWRPLRIVYGSVGERKGGASSLFKQSCDIGVKASG